MNTRIAQALNIASKAHETQKRKYDGAPYIGHLLEVNSLLSAAKVDEDTIIAGLLHDVIEDTTLSAQQIELFFGRKVKEMVISLSDDKSLCIETRHEITLQHLPSLDGCTIDIKLADLISNICTIPVSWDETKRTDYLSRCRDILDVITTNPSCKSAFLENLASFILNVQVKDDELYTHLSNWALSEKLYWSTDRQCFLHLPVFASNVHEGTRLESNFDKLFKLGLLHRLKLTNSDAITIRETSCLDGDSRLIQNKQLFVHKACIKVRLQ